MNEGAALHRFDGVSQDYDGFRPAYPAELLAELAELMAATGAEAPLWIDVGSGTGIFTRQLAAVLPPSVAILGVEPSRPMREKALARAAGPSIRYCEGTAEALPAGDGTVQAVSAATAAHWFDRPRFYAEAERVLAPGGLLVIADYLRDVENFPAAAALEAYLRREGEPRGYDRPDYAAEQASLPAFEPAAAHSQDAGFRLDPAGFVGLGLSSSHSRPCVARLGEDRVRADLAAIAREYLEPDGRLLYGYRFRLFVARKLGPAG